MNDLLWRMEKARRGRITAAGALALLALGAAFAGWTVVRQDRWMREDLIFQTRLVGQTLQLDRILELEGTAGDEQKPAYRRLKEQLMAVQQISPAWRWVYLMGRTTNGAIYIQIDSEPVDSPDMSPPGQRYDEATPELHAVFNTGLSSIEGPLKDRWGTWISAFVPLKDPRTGRLIMVAGIDIEAGQWNRMRLHAAKIPLLAGAALLAIWLGGSFLLARRARPGTCQTPFCRHLESFLTAAAGLVLTAAAAWLAFQAETRTRTIAFRHFANTETGYAVDAAQELRNLELTGFAAFIANSEEVTYEEFQEYGQYLLRLPEVVYWTWSEEVPAANRAEFERNAAIRSRQPNYRIWEKGGRGHPVRAGTRDVYYPIVRLIPDKDEPYVLGFDLGSDPARRTALETALRTGFATASAPTTFLQASPIDKGILIVQPVFDPRQPGRLKGFISAGLKVRSWLRASRTANPDRRPMAFLDLFQLQQGQPALWMGTTQTSQTGSGPAFGGWPVLTVIRPMLIFGKAYAIVARPTPEFLHLYPAIIAWLVALAGVVVTGSMAWALGFFANRRETLARMLDEQHHELASNMRRYDLLARQSRTYRWETDADGLFTDVSGVVTDVLGYAPEELIGRKHFYDLHPDADREEFMALAFDAFARRQPFSDLANPVVAKSGEIIWVSTNGLPLLDAEGNLTGYQGTDKDITERKRAEDDLRFQAQLLNCVSEAITAADMAGRIQYWNHEAERLYGYLADEVLGRPFRDYAGGIPPPDEEAFRREVLYRGFWRGEHLQRRKDGTTFWTASFVAPIRDAHGQPTGFIGIDQDITERKQAEESLARLARQNKEAAERYAALISASNTGAWEYHDDTAFMWASPEYFSMLGRRFADFDLGDQQPNIEQIWLDLLHPDDKDRARQDFVDYMKHPAGMYQHTFRMRHADGHWVWILSRGRMLHDAQGRPTPVVVGTHIDISESKRAEEALRESEQKFRTLFNEMLEGFSVHDIICDAQGRPADYRFLDVNPAFERLTGLKAADILGKTALEVLPQLERYWIEEFGRVALTGEPAFLQQFAGPLGKHYEVTVFRPAAMQFACIFSDVTERKRAENELQESRRQYVSLLANLPGMAYRCANDRNWTMDFVSAGCRDLTGYASDELVGNKVVSFNDLILPAHRERLWEKWQRILPAYGKFEDEYEITTRSGATKWVWEQGEGVYDAEGRVVALEGFIADITERKRAGIERERLTRAIEQSLEIILITDNAGAIVYVNPAFTRATGYTREEVLGQNPRLLQSGQHDRGFYQIMWQTLLAGRNWEGQIVNRRKDGSLCTEMATISPVRDADGRIVNYVAVKRDITAEIQNQKEKDDLQLQLVQAQKMESIGRLAGGVAHDFNNMLQAILGYTEMALEQVKPGEPLHTDLKEIQKASQRSAALTRQLQAFARKQIALPRILDLNEAVAGMTGMLRRLIGEKIELVWKPGRALGLVKIDPGQLDQVVANLCINARDAIVASGRIVIETRNVEIPRPPRPAPGDLPPGSHVVLSIQDNGTGMGPDVLEHLFEPFFTTKQPGKGTGLGLATVYGIVKQNNGEIQVHSEPDKGTTFQIFLPRQTGAAERTPDETDAEPLSRGHETILLVEDETTILQAARRILESLGYRVLATASALEAVQLAEKHKARIQLLLTDVIMPEMNGPELVRRLLVRHPRLHYLYMSGYTANLIAE